MRNAFLHGFQTGLRQWRITAIVYFLQLCLALTVGMQVYEVLEASIGNSLEINKLLAHYDHTVITDFLKVHGASITPLIGQLRWLLLAWLLFSVFTNGGLLYCATLPGKASWQSFWQGGALNFFPFLKISLLFLFLLLVWTALIWLPLMTFLEPSFQYFSSEKYSVWQVYLFLAFWLAGVIELFIWSALSRIIRLQGNAKTFACLKSGWRAFRKRKARFTGLFLGFAGLHVLLTAAYFLLEAFTGMTSPFLILFLFVVQQAFVFFRIQIRQMIYAGLHFIAA